MLAPTGVVLGGAPVHVGLGIDSEADDDPHFEVRVTRPGPAPGTTTPRVWRLRAQVARPKDCDRCALLVRLVETGYTLHGGVDVFPVTWADDAQLGDWSAAANFPDEAGCRAAYAALRADVAVRIDRLRAEAVWRGMPDGDIGDIRYAPSRRVWFRPSDGAAVALDRLPGGWRA